MAVRHPLSKIAVELIYTICHWTYADRQVSGKKLNIFQRIWEVIGIPKIAKIQFPTLFAFNVDDKSIPESTMYKDLY